MERESKELAPPSARTANMGRPLPVTQKGANQERKARRDILAVLDWGRGVGVSGNSDNGGYEGDFISIPVRRGKGSLHGGIESRRKVRYSWREGRG